MREIILKRTLRIVICFSP